MRFKGTIVVVGVVCVIATLGCSPTKTNKPASDQKPPEVTFGDQKRGDEAPSQPKAGGVPKPPPAATTVEPADEAAVKADKADIPATDTPATDTPATDTPATDTLELPGSAPAAPAAAEAPAAADADRNAPGAGTIGDLRRALAAATNEDGRVLAVDAIADLGQNALPALDDLVTAVGDENIRLRWHAARAIGRIGEDAYPVLPKLVALLKDADPIVVTQAAAAIREIRADEGNAALADDHTKAYSEAVDALSATLVNADPRVRRGSLKAIAALCPEPGKLANLLDDMLSDADPSVVMPAVESLADLGVDAVPVLVESLKHPKSRYWATVALTEIGPAAAPAAGALTAAALNGEPEERMQAMLALAAIGEPAAEAADELSAALDSPDTAVKSSAAYALGRMRVASADAALERASADGDPFLAGIASWARARIHPEDKTLVSAALATLSTALGSDRVNTRIAAMSALSDLTESLDDADEATLADRFVALLEDGHPAVRGAAATSLVRLGPTAIAALEKALDKPALRTLAIEVLAACGSKAKSAVDNLVAALSDADPATRGDAAVALAAIGPDAAEAVPALTKLLAGDENEAGLRYAAAYALGRIGPAAAPVAESLRGLATSDDELMATVAVWALLKIEPANKAQVATAVPVLRQALRSKRDLARLEAASALGDLGDAAVSAVPILELVSEDDPLPAVRGAAAAALAKIKALSIEKAGN